MAGRADAVGSGAAGVLHRGRGGEHVVDAVLLGRGGGGVVLDLPGSGETGQHRHRDRLGVDVEVAAGGGTGVGEAEPVGAEGGVVAGHPLPDLVGHRAHPVGSGDERAFGVGECGGHERHRCRLVGVAQGLAVAVDAFAAQFTPRGDRPDVGRDTPVVGEQLRGALAFGHGDARDEDLGARPRQLGPLVQIDAPEQAVDVEVVRFGGLHVRLVVDRQVVEDVLAAETGDPLRTAVHAADPVPDDVRDLVGERGVVGDGGGVGRREQQRVPVGVLQALTGERGAAGGGAEDEAAGHLVGRRPQSVAGALEPEHRIEDVQRDHRLAVGGVGGADRGERRRRTGLVDTLVQDLADAGLLVRQHQFGVDGGVQLTVAVVDLQRREPRVHTERAGLVGNDRHDSLADLLVPQQFLDDADQRHRGRDLLLARSLADGVERGDVRHRQWRCVGVPRRQEPAECLAAVEHVPDLRGVGTGVVVRRQVRVLLQLRVGDRDPLQVTERLEVVEGELLHLVGGVAALEVLAEGVALDGVRQDHRRLALVRHRGGVGGVDLAVVVTTALEVPDLLVAEVLDEFLGARVAAEEVFANVAAVVGLVGLVVAVGGDVHQVDQGAVLVGVEQRIPFAAPHDLDDVPAGTAEERLQLLDDLAVAADRAVEALQVAVDDEGEVVESFGGGDVREATRFRLVHLAVAEECPHVLLRGVLQAAVVQVVVEASLVDGVHRAQAHRHRGELPEIGQQAWVRVGREAAAGLRMARLLTEAVHLRGGDAALEEGASVDAGGGVALDEDVVAAAGVVLAAEEVVEPDLVQGGGGCVGGDVAAHADAGALCAVHHDRGVPADPGAVAAFDFFVTGEPRLVLGGDGVDEIGRGQCGDGHAVLAGAFEQTQHQIAGACGSRSFEQVVEALDPFAGFVRIDVGEIRRDALSDDADPAVGTGCGTGCCWRYRVLDLLGQHLLLIAVGARCGARYQSGSPTVTASRFVHDGDLCPILPNAFAGCSWESRSPGA
ncbi:arginase/agmatinase/formimionoglutamate hydrolase, arginase family protein [Rhodococcus triatomae BKS 15-14]|nr:arginase/agmatinase/formimionoglutamate hydrolase, arginase family protein [Rhodococcus triatomae BKS 15-14]